jgi:Flp pilus assembly pilin Flp
MINQPSHVRCVLRQFIVDESGPSATEYAILLALLVLGSMGVIGSIGHDFQGVYLAIAGKMPAA